MSTNLLVEREGRVLRLTLNRPAKRNALSADLCRELIGRLGEAESDAGAGAVLLEAAGPVFCSGMDLEEASSAEAAGLSALHEQLFSIAGRMSKPVVAAVQGPALGAGLGLLAVAHTGVAAQGASFGLTEIRIGLFPFAAYPAIERAVGERRAVELALTGRIFGTQEALHWGLVSQVVPPFELDDRAADLAAHLAASSAEAIRRGLEFVREARGKTPEESRALAARFLAETIAGADYAEGLRAFHEKRQPRWPSQPES
jgi:enoyl-CoA hydratase/carnithine racemase